MNQEMISIVVPVYNVQDYLSECIESVLRQTYTNFELLLVDDGSKDDSGKICDLYEGKDDRIRVFHKKNGGLSDARNYAIPHAKGEYIMFLDSDDYLSIHCLEYMLKTMIDHDLNIVQGFFTREESTLDHGAIDSHHVSLFLSEEEILRSYFMYGLIEGHACNKLYKTYLFKDLRYPFGKIQEDAWTTYKALFFAKRVGVMQYNTYFYRYNNQSIMNGKFDVRRFDALQVPAYIKAFLNEQNVSFSLDKELDYFSMRLGLKTYNDCINSGADSVYKTQMENTRKYILDIPMNISLWGKKYCLMVTLLRLSSRLYKQAIRRFR